MSLLYFQNITQLSDFAKSLIGAFENNPEYVAATGNNTGVEKKKLWQGKIILAGNYLSEMMEQERLGEKKMQQGPAYVLHSCLRKYETLMADLQYLADCRQGGNDNNIDRETEKEINNRITAVLATVKELGNGKFRDALNAFYEEHGQKEYFEPAMEIVTALCQSAQDAGNLFAVEQREWLLRDLEPQVKALHEAEEKNCSEITKLTEDCRKLGVDSTKIAAALEAQKNAVSTYEKQLVDIADAAANAGKDEKAIQNELKTIRSQLEIYEHNIQKYQSEFVELDKFKTQASEELKGLQLAENMSFLDANKVSELEEDITSMEAQREIYRKNTAEHTEHIKQLENFVNAKSNRAIVKSYREQSERLEKLTGAFKKMEELMREKKDFRLLLIVTNNGKNLSAVSPAEQGYLKKYYEAKNDLIRYYPSDPKDRSMEKVFTDLEQTDRGDYMIAQFMGLAGSRCAELIGRLEEDVKSYAEKNKTVIDQYRALSTQARFSGDCKARIAELDATIKRYKGDIKKLQDDRKNREKAIQKWHERARKLPNLQLPEKLSTEIIRDAVGKRMTELAAKHKELVTNSAYAELSRNRDYLEKKRNDLLARNFKQEKIATSKQLKEAESRLQNLEILNNRQIEYCSTLKRNCETGIALQKNYPASDLKDGRSHLRERLEFIQAHLYDKSKEGCGKVKNKGEKTGNSPEFQGLSSALDALCNTLDDPSATTGDIERKLHELKGKATTYLCEKNRQWRPKFLASEQRAVRLTFVKEILGLCNTGKSLLTGRSVMSKQVQSFLKKDYTKGSKDPVTTFRSIVESGGGKVVHSPNPNAI